MAYSVNRGEHWDISCWLIFDSGGGVRLTRGEPDLSRNERGMKLRINIPHTLFRTPTLTASMTIEAQEPIVPPIDLTTAAQALKQAMGVDVDVRIVMPEEA